MSENLFAPAEWVETTVARRLPGLVRPRPTMGGWRCECVAWCGIDHTDAGGGRCEGWPAIESVAGSGALVCGPCHDAGTARSMADTELRDRLLDAGPACVLDPELFTGPDEAEETEPAHERAAREAAATDMCAECPVRALCAEYAHRTRPMVGIWAGRPAEDYHSEPAAAVETEGSAAA